MAESNDKAISEKGFDPKISSAAPWVFSVRLSQQLLDRLEVMYEDVERRCGFFPLLRESMLKLTCQLAMNEVELAAWGCLLQKAMRSQDLLPQHSQNLALTAYHAKSLLSRDLRLLSSFLIAQHSEFLDRYRGWLKAEPAARTVSLEELNKGFRKMSLKTETIKQPETMTSVVNSIVDVRPDSPDRSDFPPGEEGLFPVKFSPQRDSSLSVPIRRPLYLSDPDRGEDIEGFEDISV